MPLIRKYFFLAIDKMQMKNNGPNNVKLKILRYLIKNPNAKDTLRGICDWWLLEEGIDETIEIVSNAIELLLSQQLLLVDKKHGTEELYQINEAKREEILKILDI